MPKKQALTVAELKLLILARFNAEQSKQMKLNLRIQQELGNEVEEEKPETIAIKNKLADWISDMLAHRLKRNRRTVTLLSFQDFVRFVPSMISEMEKMEGDELDTESRKVLENFTKALIVNSFKTVHEMIILPYENPYEEYWRWIMTTLKLATERSIPPIELLKLESATDEIARRMFTKRQFIVRYRKAMKKFMDINELKKIIVSSTIDMLGIEADEEDRRELERELEAELMPWLRRTVNVSKVVISAWLNEEVKRIYAVA